MGRREYSDTLRSGGWLADPGENVQVVPLHHPTCPSQLGRACRCSPRLTLRSVTEAEREAQISQIAAPRSAVG